MVRLPPHAQSWTGLDFYLFLCLSVPFLSPARTDLNQLDWIIQIGFLLIKRIVLTFGLLVLHQQVCAWCISSEKTKQLRLIFFATTLFFITLKISINSALMVPGHSFRHGRTVPGLSQGLSPRTKVKKRVCRHVRNQKSDYRLKRFIVDLFLFSLNNDVNFVVTKEKWRKRKASRDYTGH